jgi:non-specific serine/threonine protein kinase
MWQAKASGATEMASRTRAQRAEDLRLVREMRYTGSPHETDESEWWAEQCHTGLPAQPTALVGREPELEALGAELLGGTRLLTLTGPGGVGKTRLAVELARGVEQTFSDGAAFVDLTHCTESDLVPASIARTLGLQTTGNVSVLKSLSRFLSTRNLLLVLDGFEYVVAAAPELGELLADCSGLTAIVTSLEPLHLRWERVQPILPLITPDLQGTTLEDLQENPCVRLFVQRAQAVHPEFTLVDSNARHVAEICVRLEGLPLAIELQAARVNVLTPAAMVARLDERFSLLHRQAPDAPERQQSLEATLEWGYDTLNDQERALLPSIAVFGGGFDLDMATAVAGPEATEVHILEQLASLVDKSFLLPSLNNGPEPRFRFLETVRAYVLKRASAQTELEAARERHCGYFLALAEKSLAEIGSPQQKLWASRVDREYDNLLEALSWAARCDDDTELRLVVALVPYWLVRGQVREGTHRVTDALARHPSVDTELRVEALDGLANLLRWKGRFESANGALDEALPLARSLNRPILVDRLLLNQAILLAAQGEIESARSVLADMLPRWQERGDTRGAALTIQHQGIIELVDGEREPATRLLEESVAMFQQLGDLERSAEGLIALSRLAGLKGETTRAAVLLVEALRVSSELNVHRLMCAAVEQAAGVLVATVQPETVAGLLAVADTARRIGGFVCDVHEESMYEDARAALVARAGEQSVHDWLAAAACLSLQHASDQALALLADVASPPARPQKAETDTGKLSRREYEVLQFVAQGLSNKQIAHVLLISENTVKYHVTSLLNKLGADTRAQTVALAAQLNLLQHNH